MSNSNPKLTEKIVVKFQLELVTGMRIGSTDSGIAIGAIDSPVIRNPINGQPYIPGSSLKGKLRCALERVTGNYTADGKQGADKSFKDTPTARLFGIAPDTNSKDELKERLAPTRLIVRDAFLDDESVKKLESPHIERYLDSPYTEVKTEIGVDRLTGGPQKGNLRSVERVPSGVKFNCEVVLSIWNTDDKDEYIRLICAGLTLLETEYLGGSGSRGYGQVKVIPKEAISLKFSDNADLETEVLELAKAIPFKSLIQTEPNLLNG